MNAIINQSGRVNGIDPKQLTTIAESMYAIGWRSYEPAAVVKLEKAVKTTARAVLREACPALVWPVSIRTGYDEGGKPERVEVAEVQAEGLKIDATLAVRHGVTRYCASLLCTLAGKPTPPVFVPERENEPQSGLTVAGVVANELLGRGPSIDDYCAVMRPVWVAGKRKESAILKALNGIKGDKGKAQKLHNLFQLQDVYKNDNVPFPDELKNSNHATLAVLLGEIKTAGGVAQAEEKRAALAAAADALVADENNITAMPALRAWEDTNVHKLPVVAQSLLIALQSGKLADVRALCERFKPGKPVTVDKPAPGVTTFGK